MNNVFDKLQKDWKVNDDLDKIVDDIPVKNGEPVTDPGLIRQMWELVSIC